MSRVTQVIKIDGKEVKKIPGAAGSPVKVYADTDDRLYVVLGDQVTHTIQMGLDLGGEINCPPVNERYFGGK
jgi:hypothetical protein